jgi:hypothetical protein
MYTYILKITYFVLRSYISETGFIFWFSPICPSSLKEIGSCRTNKGNLPSPPLTPFPLPGIDTKQLYIKYIFADFPVPGFPIEGLPRFTKK